MSTAVSLKSYSSSSTVMSRSRSSSSSSSLYGVMRTRTPSVYGGAGGHGTLVSQASVLTSGLHGEACSNIIDNEKVTMQNLNDRLASYLDKVRFLEQSNRKLELQIREYTEKRMPSATRDYAHFFATIADLRAKITKRHLENQSLILQLDNAQLASDDFKIKSELEMNIRNTVEVDVARLRVVRDDFTLRKSDLELQIEGLKEELIHLKKSHEEEMVLLRAQHGGSVNVEVDSAESVDLTKVLTEVRHQYESLMEKNRSELEKWFQTKAVSFNTQITTSTEEVKIHHSQLSELKRTFQSLEIDRESSFSQIRYLEQNLAEIKGRYSLQLTQLQMTINVLEVELKQLRVSIENQQLEYNELLDVKMRLELEIAEYRRLLGEELETQRTVVTKVVEQVVEQVVEEVEEHKPHIERRVKTIVEEIVDGVVVTSKVDTHVEDIQ